MASSTPKSRSNLAGWSHVLAAGLRRVWRLCRDESRRRTSLTAVPRGALWCTAAGAAERVSLDAAELRGALWRPAAENKSRAEQRVEAKASAPSGRGSGRDLAGSGLGLRRVGARTDTFSAAASAPSKNSLGLHSGTFGNGLTLETRASHPHWRPTVKPEGRLVETAKVPHIRGRPFGRAVY